MPELPEVEFARRHLDRWAKGRRVLGVEAGHMRVLGATPPRAFARKLEGARYRDSERRGKNIVARLSRGREEIALRIHLGMTGKLLKRTRRDPAPRFTRVSFVFSGGVVVHYADLRLFGQLEAGAWQTLRDRAFAALGPDPIADGLDAKTLAAALERTKLPVKVAIMDQARLAGVGNIYAAEACWRAKLSPLRRADSLSRAELSALARGILAALRHGMRTMTGEDAEYVEEGAENPFQVYDRAGARCPRCGAPIVRIVQAGRSTFFCRRCQR